MRCKFILLSLIIIFLITGVSADYSLGNKSHEIAKDYAKDEFIKGWVNISFDQEPTSSIIEIFNKRVNLTDFLGSCISPGCECLPDCDYTSYDTKGSELLSEDVTLNYQEKALYGIKLTGNVSSIDLFKFDIDLNAPESCLHPLTINFLEGDRKITWKPKEISTSYCSDEFESECWDEGESDELFSLSVSGEDKYFCQDLRIPMSKGVWVGANVVGNGSASFDFEITTETQIPDKGCTASVSEEGEIGCKIEFLDELQGAENATVCLISKSINNYSVSYEREAPICGKVEQNSQEAEYDFGIFAYSLKYSSLSDIVFDDDIFYEDDPHILTEEISAYLQDKYETNNDGRIVCNPECIVPFEIISGVSQEQLFTINNLKLNHGVDVKDVYETKFFELEEEENLITSNFKKIRLDNLNFPIPNMNGTHFLNFRINGDLLFVENISIKGLPVINAIITNKAPAFVETTFLVILENDGVYTYDWDFGDGTSATTNQSNVKHIYQELGNFTLKVTVSGDDEQISKSIKVDVISTQDSINDTISDYRAKINNFENSTKNYQDWIKEALNKKLDIANLKSQISLIEGRFEAASSDQYFELIKSLSELKIPSKIKKGNLGKIPFYNLPSQLDFETLDYFYEDKIENNAKDHTGIVNSWIQENADIDAQVTTYAVSYQDNSEEVLYSEIKLTILPKSIDRGIRELYVIINENRNNLVFAQDYLDQEINSVSTITLESLDELKTISFLYPSLVNQFELPIFISPRSAEIIDFGSGGNSTFCNNNGKCDKSNGENWKNCRVDCKPVGNTILLLLILIFIALAVYIVLQEWYKRHYQSHLFPNKNQLFNLINFMYISQTQGLKKSEIFDKLQEMDWSREQLNYAWNKLNGKRTGMWEIPVFKWIENRNVKKEIDKRKPLENKKPPLPNINQMPNKPRNFNKPKGFAKPSQGPGLVNQKKPITNKENPNNQNKKQGFFKK
jgi:PKD repeat protein